MTRGLDAGKVWEALCALAGLKQEEETAFSPLCTAAAHRVEGMLRNPTAERTPAEEELLTQAAAGLAWRMGLLRQGATGARSLRIGDLHREEDPAAWQRADRLTEELLLAAAPLLRLSSHGLWVVPPAGEGARL